ncbi:MAG: type II toxin-antitoxin system Phd/YefM family antitoxin [Acidobacteriota bacterium]|nr:type II toxin-antitoxin system prevent-host-death family antitoxin [Acidobacteriota bacterium]MDQ3417288.1 type II toxin-antitoxin system Phd/YefM family antitoxin [Acidobacteriota bacterium]
MKHMKVAEARARFGEILDEAQKGAEVVIERRGVRFRLTAEPVPAARRIRPPLFESVDASLLDGQWTWQAGPSGLTFRAGRKPR